MTRSLILVRQSITHKDSVSLEAQETACRAYCDREGYTVVGVAVVGDDGVRVRYQEPFSALVPNPVTVDPRARA